MRLGAGPAAGQVDSLMYMPALNRAGYYKYLFLALLHEPENLEKMLGLFCSETYKPGVLHQPDVDKRDKSPMPKLAAHAASVSTAAMERVCHEAAALMQGAHGGGG